MGVSSSSSMPFTDPPVYRDQAEKIAAYYRKKFCIGPEFQREREQTIAAYEDLMTRGVILPSSAPFRAMDFSTVHTSSFQLQGRDESKFDTFPRHG
jgi:hypothetical protein